MIIDQDGNQIQDGDWLGFNIHGMARGSVVMVSEGGLTLPNNQVSPSFVNVILQIPCQPGTNMLPGVSKVFGPARPKDSIGE